MSTSTLQEISSRSEYNSTFPNGKCEQYDYIKHKHHLEWGILRVEEVYVRENGCYFVRLSKRDLPFGKDEGYLLSRLVFVSRPLKLEKTPKYEGGGYTERWAILNNFVDQTMRDLTPAEWGVWLALYRDSKQGIATTSQRYIAQRIGRNVSSVNHAIKLLKDKRLLKVVYQGGYKKGMSKYRVMGLIPVR